METLARRRLTGVAGALLLLVGLVSFVALPALAHNAAVSAGCNGLTVNLTYYNTQNDNSVVVTIDGVEVVNIADFGPNYFQVVPWSNSANHTYSVVVQAWDDPTGSKGWSKSWNGSWQACNPTTTTTQATTTTAPPSTTTTVQQTTSTTVPPSTTTTVQQSTTTTGHTTTTGGPPDTTTTTTVTETTPSTTAAPTTSTAAAVGVAGVQVSAPVAAQVTQATLPFTGISTTGMAVVAAGLAAMGLVLLAVSRRSEEKDPVRSWT